MKQLFGVTATVLIKLDRTWGKAAVFLPVEKAQLSLQHSRLPCFAMSDLG